MDAAQPSANRSLQMEQLVIELAVRALAMSAGIGALITGALLLL
jgi:hypothetical protein